jgi:hypothetical protein
MSESIVVHANRNEPVVFTQDELGWLPWLDPFPEADLTERHWAGLVDRSRAKSDYFRLLVRDPEVLEARTKTDKDIFYNTADGLPRAERTRGSGDIPLQRMHLLRVRARALRHGPFQAPRRCSAPARRRRGRRSRSALERRCQGFGCARLDAHRIRQAACRGTARRGSR